MKKQVLFTILMLLPMVTMADDSGKCGDNLTYNYDDVKKRENIIVNASFDEPVNLTAYIQNPNFDQGNIEGWDITSGIGNNLQYNMTAGTYNLTLPDGTTIRGHYNAETGTWMQGFIEVWHPTDNVGNGTISQTLVDLPAGKYSFACDAIACRQSAGKQESVGIYLFVESDGVTIKLPISTDNEMPEHFELNFISRGGDIKFGLTAQGSTANWMAADNFELWYYGNPLDNLDSTLSNIITFTDKNVQELCLEYWDWNSDGELSEAEAAIVPSVANVFQNNTDIESFNELKYFTGLKKIDDCVFSGCTGLVSVAIPDNIEYIGNYAFNNCGALNDIYCLSKVIPTISSTSFNNTNNITLHVPISLLDDYKQTADWKDFYNIVALPSIVYKVDNKVYKIVEYIDGEVIVAEKEPTREGYTFSGWSDIPETMPDHDITISGSFIINKYKVTYIVDGTVFKTEEVEYGSTLKPETPTKEGYTFSGWKNLPNTMPAHDVTVTGSFSINSYSLTYIVDGVEYKTATVEYGTPITPEVAPTKEGYTFSGWSEIPETMPAHDITVTGNFTINKYKVTYIVDGTEYKTEEVEYGSEMKPETPTKEGYSFEWIDLPMTMPAHDIVVNGSFTINQYKVIFTVDGTEYQTIEVEYGADVNPIEEPAKMGYTFSGWIDIPETMPAYDVVVNGNFSVNYYTISYVVNDNIYMTDSVAYGTEAIPIDGPEREGYTFIGWTGFPTTMPAHDVIAVGFYTVNSYKVTFMYGDNVLTTIEVKYGEKIELPTSLNSERYTLIEWQNVPETMPAQDIIIYADYVDGINDIAADSRDAQYIQLNGMYNPDLKPGLNIIRMKDGTTKKVWVK